MSTKVLYEASGGIGWITMNDPDRRNALSEELVGGLISVIKAADADGGVRVMVLTGTGMSFSAGGDLAVFAESARKSAPQHHEEGEIHTELFRLGATVRKPIIAAVNGHALGGGCGLVAMCHIALAAEEAKLGTTEIKVGLVPLVILPWIRRTVGHKNALRMMLTGDVMNAEEAGEYCAVLRPKVAVPTHYAFTAGPMRDRLFLKYDGTPERFQRAVAHHAPETNAQVLAPGEPLTLDG